ncbi:MAG: hypothetical protein H6907_04715 [Hyphomicrobiales bacterium]|nr:hypothetical protein [Hyphomicrobiales bacterium]MCP5371016.1 hypothetical protein [Hyphomicrobiales bacterium]
MAGMKRAGRKTEWSVTLFCFGLLAFTPPIMTMFDRPVMVLGLPLMYLVMFGVWAAVILAIGVGARRSRLSDSADEAGLKDGEPW